MPTEDYLPIAIEIAAIDGTLEPMSVRKIPLVLRMHSSAKKGNAHETYYSEMLLYHPWRHEGDDLALNDFEDCLTKYENRIDRMTVVKKMLFPFAKEVTQAMDRDGLQRAQHIAVLLDNEGEQENADDQSHLLNGPAPYSALHPEILKKGRHR